MKRLILALLLLTSATLFAQETATEPEFRIPRTLIKLAPLQFFSSTLEMGLEAFNPEFTRSFDMSLGFRSNADAYNDARGGNLELGYRKYVSPMKIHTRKHRQFYQGIYYSVFVRGSYFKGSDVFSTYDPLTSSYTEIHDSERVLAGGPGFTLGLQKTLWQIIFLDVFIGGGIRFADIKRVNYSGNFYYSGDGLFDPAYDGIYPKIGAKIGVGL
jgi:hypothetical protein